MAWERRRKGSATGYYYRSVRVGEQVKKIYVGRGAEAYETDLLLQQERHARREAERLLQEARHGGDEASQLAREVEEWAVGLLHIWLIATGHHKILGHWRRMRRTRNG